MILPKALSQYIADKVYCSDNIVSRAAILDSSDCTQVIALGRDCVINIFALHRNPCNKLGNSALKFPMAQDVMRICVQSFGSDEEPRFLEAIQDAVIAATVNPGDTHDEDGFVILRPKQLAVYGSAQNYTGVRYDTSRTLTMPQLACAIGKRKNHGTPIYGMDKVEDVQAGHGWRVDVSPVNRHTKLVDAICMIFMLADDNVDIDRNRSCIGHDIDSDTEYEWVQELMKFFGDSGADLSPIQATYVLYLMQSNIIPAQHASAYRSSPVLHEF